MNACCIWLSYRFLITSKKERTKRQVYTRTHTQNKTTHTQSLIKKLKSNILTTLNWCMQMMKLFLKCYVPHPTPIFSLKQITWQADRVVKYTRKDLGRDFGKVRIMSFLPLHHIGALILDVYIAIGLGSVLHFARHDALSVSVTL